jgi:hypothetical protein
MVRVLKKRERRQIQGVHHRQRQQTQVWRGATQGRQVVAQQVVTEQVPGIAGELVELLQRVVAGAAAAALEGLLPAQGADVRDGVVAAQLQVEHDAVVEESTQGAF